MRKSTTVLIVLLLTVTAALVQALAASAATTEVRVNEAYGKLPLSFEANRGQSDPRVRFLARGGRHVLFLTPSEAVLVFTRPKETSWDEFPTGRGTPRRPEEVVRTTLRMSFVGANPTPRVAGLEELPGRANYFIGKDPAKWRTNVPTYARVQYRDLYPGIDLIFYGNQRHLEYDFVLRPGADPKRIVLRFQGAETLEVDGQGDLVLHTAGGAVRQKRPVIYQEVDGVRRDVSGGYVLKRADQLGFHVGAYDASRPLVIDPVLFYSTYLGNSDFQLGAGIAVDAAGNTYLTGYTTSTNFPTTAGAFQTTFGGGSKFTGDGFVTKLNPTGSGLVYSTYLGGSGDDVGTGVVVDTNGSAYVAGWTGSANFPTTAGAFQAAFGGGLHDAFVTKLNATGSALVYSTYLGGSLDELGRAMAADADGNAYVAGWTGSANFPTTAGAFQAAFGGGLRDVFVTKLNATGSALVYSTFLGGSDGGEFGWGIAVDAAGNAYVTGAASADFPTTPGAFKTALPGGAFVTKLNATGSALVYSTYLGGGLGLGIAVDAAGNAYVTGNAGADFPTTPGAFQTVYGGHNDTFCCDAFVTKVNPTGSDLVYSTYLGGSGGDWGRAIAVDAAGHAYVTGRTSWVDQLLTDGAPASTDFPTTVGAPQPIFGGGPLDAFVTKLNPTGSGLVYSTYLGGNGLDDGVGIVVDAFPNPNAYVTGGTNSINFPTTPGAFQPTPGVGVDQIASLRPGHFFDAFVAKISDIVLELLPGARTVSGGGTIDVTGGKANFSFLVQGESATGAVSGDLQYVNHASGAKVQSVAFDSVVITGNMATFEGTCTNNGVSCTFGVNVTDDGEPGSTDTFTISVSGGPPEGGMLRSGNIQIQ